MVKFRVFVFRDSDYFVPRNDKLKRVNPRPMGEAR
jgi:hypothetical protein